VPSPTIELPARNSRAALGVNAVVKKKKHFFHRLPSFIFMVIFISNSVDPNTD
jgi:hypothetical protein